MSVTILARTQQLLWKLTTAPEGVAAGLACLDPADRALAESLVRPGGRLSAVERLDIYADMYFYRLRDCLQEDFAAVHAVIGADCFHNLVTDYLLAHPPAHFSLRQAGRHLPGFISGHPLSARWPFVAQLAAVEWAVLEAFDAPDAPPIDLAVFQGMPPEEWPDLRFRLTPSLQRLHLDWRVDDVLRSVHDGATPPVPDAAARWLRVWRQDMRVFHRPMDAAEAAALDVALRGETFATVCAAVGELIGEAAGAERLAQLLDTWCADGLVTGCGPEGTSG
jgi:hypothetical protein